jgi:hypothetical protein
LCFLSLKKSAAASPHLYTQPLQCHKKTNSVHRDVNVTLTPGWRSLLLKTSLGSMAVSTPPLGPPCKPVNTQLLVTAVCHCQRPSFWRRRAISMRTFLNDQICQGAGLGYLAVSPAPHGAPGPAAAGHQPEVQAEGLK